MIGTPFFRSHDTETVLDRDQAHESKVSVLTNVTCADEILHNMYRGIESPDHGFTVEGTGWQFFSPDEMASRQDAFGSKFIDIALQYQGMGHVNVIGYIPSTKKFFMRPDGGANGYERAEHFETYSGEKYVPAEFQSFVPKTTFVSVDDDGVASKTDPKVDEEKQLEAIPEQVPVQDLPKSDSARVVQAQFEYPTELSTETQYTYEDLMQIIAPDWKC